MGRRSGVTLIELIVVMAVVGTLASIVTPRVVGVSRQARESQMRAQLRALRNAVAVFRAQCGDYPGDLDDVVADSGTTGMTGGNGLPISGDDYAGPYFTATPTGQIPIDPTTGLKNWVYTATTGLVRSGSTNTATDGTDYSTW